MKRLIKNGLLVDVVKEKIKERDILIEDGVIIGIGNYNKLEVDDVIDAKGKYICPGFIDGHIHIESTMLSTYEFSKVVLANGTTSVMTDPHEITNVCGLTGIEYMIKESSQLPLDIFVMLPSCVPATCFDESYETIDALKLEEYLDDKRVLGLAEMMNFVGVINDDKDVWDKINMAKKHNKLIDGHAPGLLGSDLEKYVGAGINSDHECSTLEEAYERLKLGQWIMIREGTAARNLEALYSLINSEYYNKCLFVTDDKEPSDLLNKGHINHIIKKAISLGVEPIKAIKAATINAAKCFKLKDRGFIENGYIADINILSSLEDVTIDTVLKNGEVVYTNNSLVEFPEPHLNLELKLKIMNSIHIKNVKVEDLIVTPTGKYTRVMEIVPGELITNELLEELDYTNTNGIDINKDILKIAVIERHKKTGHIGIGYIKGLGLKEGAIASTVSHDSHNIIVVGTNEEDMVAAIKTIKKINGGNVVVKDGKVISTLSLPIGGLMSDLPAKELAIQCEEVRNKVHELGVPNNIAPFMNMAFTSLPVIPKLKITTKGYVDVSKFKLVPLFENSK